MAAVSRLELVIIPAIDGSNAVAKLKNGESPDRNATPGIRAVPAREQSGKELHGFERSSLISSGS